jgi:hypothetical protein
MDPWNVLLRYAFMGFVIFFFILGKGANITGSNQMKLTVAILLLFALLDIFTGTWAKIKRFLCERGVQ